jgi:hypothetical protein
VGAQASVSNVIQKVDRPISRCLVRFCLYGLAVEVASVVLIMESAVADSQLPEHLTLSET